MRPFQTATALQCHTGFLGPHRSPGLPDGSALARCVPPGTEPVRGQLVILLNLEVTRDESFATNKCKLFPEVDSSIPTLAIRRGRTLPVGCSDDLVPARG